MGQLRGGAEGDRGRSRGHLLRPPRQGMREDAKSRSEFAKLKDFGALLPQTVIIHGTALTPAELREAAEVGAKLVWSPQSNLRLYRQTTDIKAALDAHLPVCLGADWMPSGSMTLLAEMRVAANEMRSQGVDVSPRRLLQMVTSIAADVAGLGDKLGRLKSRPTRRPGRPEAAERGPVPVGAAVRCP